VARPSELRRGDIWRVDFGPDIGEHPVLLVSRTGSMRRRWRAVIALITSEAIGLPTEVSVGLEHGLDRDSTVDCEDLYTVSSDLLTRRTGEVDQSTQDAVDRALRIALGLSDAAAAS
jgi:mRNA-degrading endonuclease toxin of MazEF toxin-antitoxin module